MTSQTDRPVLITGGSTGIGRMTVELLASKGHQVYATVRKDKDFEELSKIENVTPVKCDVTDLESISRLRDFVKEQAKGLYGLINNSGVTDLIAMTEMDDEDFDYIMKVNVYGPIRVTKALHEFIIEAEGRIVNIGSVAGIVTPNLMGAYSISKHAIEAYTDAIAWEMKKFNVHVSVIEPGNYKSNIAKSAGMRIINKVPDRRSSKYRAEFKEAIAIPNATPERDQYPTPEPVADAIYHALYDEQPLPRYMVVPNLEEAQEAIGEAAMNLAQFNKWQEYSFSRDELVAMLDKHLN